MLATRDSKQIQTVTAGHGPLWQRDYCVVLEQSTLSPKQIVQVLRAELPEFSPDELAKFTRLDDASTPLEIGDEMQVEIRGAGTSEVRVVGLEPQVLTLRTLDGHLEAGRISFGAYEEDGKTVIRIRSRARSASRRRHAAYLLMGKALQTKVWEVFLMRVAERCGAHDVEVNVKTSQVKSTLADLGELDTPTFPAGNV